MLEWWNKKMEITNKEKLKGKIKKIEMHKEKGKEYFRKGNIVLEKLGFHNLNYLTKVVSINKCVKKRYIKDLLHIIYLFGKGGIEFNCVDILEKNIIKNQK